MKHQSGLWRSRRVRCENLLRGVALATCTVLLAGCFESVGTSSNPDTGATPVRAYTGPAPATADVAAFMTNLWNNIKSNNRCGGCHGADGQSPTFARDDDVNLAYGAAITLVDLASPEDSRMVSKVGGGHNCWLDGNSTCAAILTAYIEAWAGGTASTSSREITLTAPTSLRDPGSSKTFPSDVNDSLFATTIYPLVEDYCQDCHSSSADTAQQPYFADADISVAYEALRSSGKIDLTTPANSRLVLRLGEEFHNCWSDCSANADAMEQAITDFADDIQMPQVDATLVSSKAMRLIDGLVAAGGDRYEANLIGLWEFKRDGDGSTVYDTSGVEPALHLSLSGTEGTDYNWLGGWGVQFISARAQGSTTASKKLYDFINASGEYSIEAWVVPANVTQEGPARIISYSAGTTARNFTLGQTQYNYDFLHRSSTTNGDGEAALSTADADERLQATQQHVVVTFDAVNGRRIYVNGEYTEDTDPVSPGSLASWDDSFAFVLGNEVGGQRQWLGSLRLVAMHNRALTQEQIQQNYEAGVGEKFYLLFSIAHLIDVPQSYILFEVSEFDNYSYLFNKPKFISLDGSAQINTPVTLQGLRIGINGREATVGQAFANVDVIINSSNYSIDGVQLSSLGTLIAQEQGSSTDDFFLTFERLGDNTHTFVEPEAVDTVPVDGDPVSDIGLRLFEEIHATLSAITGVSTTEANVNAAYLTLKQQLPTVENIEGFLASHQVGVAQLAVEYCNALVEDNALRGNFFPGFNFSASAATAFDTQGEKDLITGPLLSKVVGSNLPSQPADADVKAELESLITTLTGCGGGCAADRTEAVVKATCAAALGSAVMLVQ